MRELKDALVRLFKKQNVSGWFTIKLHSFNDQCDAFETFGNLQVLGASPSENSSIVLKKASC